MKVVKEFLQSSTIHGLAQIATTDKVARLFWMFVVLTGFTVAACMIQRSDFCTGEIRDLHKDAIKTQIKAPASRGISMCLYGIEAPIYISHECPTIYKYFNMCERP